MNKPRKEKRMKETERPSTAVQEIAHDEDMEEFVQHLDTARQIWSRYPELVQMQLRDLPEPFLQGLEEHGTPYLAGEKELIERGLLKPETGENRGKTLEDFRAAAKAVADASPRVWKEASDAWHAFAASAFDPEMDVHEKAMLAVFQRVLRDGHACADTPVEELLEELVFSHGYCRALTQEHIHGQIEEFDSVWEDNVRMVRRFYKEHAELVTAPESIDDAEEK
jgi:hypothetical protein